MIMKYSKVKGYQNLIRDEETRAILNTDKSEYERYILLKKQREREENKMNEMENEIFSIKNDLNEIKDLLRSLINGS